MTNIGTVFKPNSTKAMLLGSGELGREVAIELKRLGIEVIAVDKYAGGAFRILYRDAISGLYDARVPSRHAHIAQNNAAIRASAYCYDCVAVRKLPFVREPARLNRLKNNKHAYRLNRPPSDFLSSRDFAVSSLLLLTSL